jgi:hypothetical protein
LINQPFDQWQVADAHRTAPSVISLVSIFNVHCTENCSDI